VRWIKSALDSGRQDQIALQGALFFGGKMVQAKTQQGVGEQAVSFDGVVAHFAYAEGSAVESRESFVDAVDQLVDRSIGDIRCGCRLQAGAAPLEFRV